MFFKITYICILTKKFIGVFGAVEGGGRPWKVVEGRGRPWKAVEGLEFSLNCEKAGRPWKVEEGRGRLWKAIEGGGRRGRLWKACNLV